MCVSAKSIIFSSKYRVVIILFSLMHIFRKNITLFHIFSRLTFHASVCVCARTMTPYLRLFFGIFFYSYPIQFDFFAIGKFTVAC